jgi:hypothetical protein
LIFTNTEDDGHIHVYEWMDAGYWSDDIAYCLCKLCGKERPEEAGGS